MLARIDGAINTLTPGDFYYVERRERHVSAPSLLRRALVECARKVQQQSMRVTDRLVIKLF